MKVKVDEEEEEEEEDNEEEMDDEEEDEGDEAEEEAEEDEVVGNKRKRTSKKQLGRKSWRKSRKRTKRCENCGYSMLRHKVSSQHRWGATVRSCISRGWTIEDHKKRIENLETKDREAKDKEAHGKPKQNAKAAEDKAEGYHCPVPNCDRFFILEGRLRNHLRNIHNLSPREGKAMSVSTPTNQGTVAASKENTKASSADPSSLSTTKPRGDRNKFLFKLSEDEHRTEQRVSPESYSPKDEEIAALGLLNDNFVRWDDSCRTRVGLTPLEPPRGSHFMENSHGRMFRVAIVNGKLSPLWNDFLENELDVIFGATRSQRLYEKRQTSLTQKLKTTSDKEGEDSKESPENASEEDASSTTSKAPAYRFREAPRMFFSTKFSSLGVGKQQGSQRNGNAFAKRDIFSFPSSKHLEEEAVRRSRLLPVPVQPPEPPSVSSLEDALWIEEASRLIRAAGTQARLKSGGPQYDDPFINAGLPEGLETESKRRFERVQPALSLLLDVAVAAECEEGLKNVEGQTQNSLSVRDFPSRSAKSNPQ